MKTVKIPSIKRVSIKQLGLNYQRRLSSEIEVSLTNSKSKIENLVIRLTEEISNERIGEMVRMCYEAYNFHVTQITHSNPLHFTAYRYENRVIAIYLEINVENLSREGEILVDVWAKLNFKI